MVKPDYWGHQHQFFVRPIRKLGMRHPSPNSDPYYRIGPEFLTTLDDLGLAGPYQMSYFEEEEDFDVVSPPRGVVNGRFDHTPPTPTSYFIADEIEPSEVYERDLISAFEIANRTGRAMERVEIMLEMSPLVIQGWVNVRVTYRSKRSLPYYDRMDVYEWLEAHHRDLYHLLRPPRSITVKRSSLPDTS